MLNSIPNITQDQIKFYKENGFLQIHNFLSSQDVTHLKTAMKRGIEKQKKALAELDNNVVDELRTLVFQQHVNLWKQDEEIAEITLNRRLAETAHRLSGFAGLRLWHDQALIKPCGKSRATNWHQDTPYWPMNEPGGLSIWMALDDVTKDNGCMWFIPKSRDLGSLDPVSLHSDDPMAILNHPDLKGRLDTPVCCEMKAGGVTFHDGQTLHHAGPNLSDRSRNAFVVLYMPARATFRAGPGDGGWEQHPCTVGKALENGAPLDDSDFPLLAGEEYLK